MIVRQGRNKQNKKLKNYEIGWIKLGGKDYCQDRWVYDKDGNIITSDGKSWNSETLEEIK